MLLVEFAGTTLHLVGEERDAEESLFPRIAQRMLDQFTSIPLPSVCRVNDQILKDQDKSTLGRADGDQQVDHADDLRAAAENENAPAARLLQNQPKTAHLLLAVRDEIGLTRKEIVEQVCQLGQIVDRRGFDEEFLGHQRE